MSQPVKLSDALVMDARIEGAAMERSIAGQVEFWARIGRAVERVSSRTQLDRIQQRGALPLSRIVQTVNSPEGRARLQAHLDSRPFPRFAAHPTLAAAFFREDADGTRTLGRFHKGVFEPSSTEQA